NRLDVWTRMGMPSLKLEFPHVGASDFAGEIIELGANVQNYSIGDRVAVNPTISCGFCLHCRSGEISLCDDIHLMGEHVWGGAAEYAIVPSTNLLLLPDDVAFVEAAAVALTALTSYRMIRNRAQIKPGELVLVTGSGGGVGTISVQIAIELGGRVIALTSNKDKESNARELGAEHVINYRENPEWGKEVWEYSGRTGVDIVIDSSGEKVFPQAIRALAKGGRYVTCGATTGTKGEVNLALLFWKQLSILGSTMSSHAEFEEVMDLFFQGRIAPVIDSVYTFDKVTEAHKRLEDPEHMGKIVIDMEL
ncbi:MAG: zinc-binding dehydrogenase, partial [Candidatus Kariarchaeaceae archaeon]